LQYTSIKSKLLWQFLFLLLVITACNPTRDRWINRKWHTLTGHYNVYFNGETKFNEAITAYEKGIPNDFNRTLPVLITPDEAASKGLTAAMDEVIKKMSTSISMHNIGSYTDDSYLLMGKAQFYKGDYYAALETFQYINSKYKTSNLRFVATAWIARCYAALNKQGEAEAVMGLLINELDPVKLVGKRNSTKKAQEKTNKVKAEQRSFIYAVAADLYLRQEKNKLAFDRLAVALEYAPTKPMRIRYNYILGQLSLLNDTIPAAKHHFLKVTKLLAPYDFEFNANLNLIKTYDLTNKKEVKQVKRNLKRMLRDDKNEGFYDQILFELARVEYLDKDIPNAIKHYQLSIAKSSKNVTQKALSYLALGNIYLERPDYKLGQAYYDSAAATIPKEYKDYQKIQDRKTVLNELISNILVIETEDSLQRLGKLSKTELEKRVDSWIAAAKLKAEQQAKAEKNKKEQERQAELNKPIGGPGLPALPGSAEQGQWYFYNASVMQAGQAEFFSQRKWGRRESEDFWRIAAREKIKPSVGDNPAPGAPKDSTNKLPDQAQKVDDSSQEKINKPTLSDDRSAWVKNIPYTKDEITKSNERIIDAYYNIGILYDVKIKDYKEAINNYNTLNKRYPDHEYEAEVLYNMYKIYINLKDQKNADATKQLLINKYPESKYAAILQNKVITSNEANANKELIKVYESLYNEYLTGNYSAVKTGKREVDKNFPGNAMQAKFDLLYALAVGRTDSLSLFKKELEDIVKAYPQTDVALNAQQMLTAIKRRSETNNGTANIAEPEFALLPEGVNYYVFATKSEKFDVNDLLQKLIGYNDEYHQFESLRVNTLISADGYQLVYVRDFPKLDAAINYYSGINLVNFYNTAISANVNFLHFVVSAEQFKKLLKDKKIDGYEAFFKKQLPTLIKKNK
jgi:tetratricopeptide (TPR) repeat protein